MDLSRLRSLLDKFPSVTLVVLGDYFLDRYLVVDGTIKELSLETGLEAYQVVEVRLSPGAAGTVTSNLRALGVKVVAIGIIGQDGEGLELENGLCAKGVDVSQLIKQAGRFTPSYTKPMLRASDGAETEMSRLDIKNRQPLSINAETDLLSRVRAVLPFVQGIVIVDQAEERNCGVVTDNVRAGLITLAAENPDKVFAAESRSRIGLFRNIILKPNASEALSAIGRMPGPDADVEACARELFRRASAPVFVTLGAEGVLLCDGAGLDRIQTVRVSGETDIVGAGDSVLAGIAASLCAGASAREAALVGNLVASVTVRQIGTTGVATPEQIVEAFGELASQH